MESVEAIINNNYSACKSPLCEFNYNDLGLVLTSLHLRGKDELAEKWLVDIADFVIVQSLTGHRLLPLGENVERSTEFWLASENVKECTAQVIAGKVWNELGSRDVRDVVKVARLASSIEEIPFVVRILNKQYRFDGTNKNWAFIMSFKTWYSHPCLQS